MDVNALVQLLSTYLPLCHNISLCVPLVSLFISQLPGLSELSPSARAITACPGPPPSVQAITVCPGHHRLSRPSPSVQTITVCPNHNRLPEPSPSVRAITGAQALSESQKGYPYQAAQGQQQHLQRPTCYSKRTPLHVMARTCESELFMSLSFSSASRYHTQALAHRVPCVETSSREPSRCTPDVLVELLQRSLPSISFVSTSSASFRFFPRLFFP